MQRDNRTKKYFENMMRSPFNYQRVIIENGKMMVHCDYENPYNVEIESLVFKALDKVDNLHKLATELSKISDGTSSNSIYLYLRYFSFKHYVKALQVKELLQKFLASNT